MYVRKGVKVVIGEGRVGWKRWVRVLKGVGRLL